MPGIGSVSVDVDTHGLMSARAKLLLAPEVVELAGRAATQDATDYAADVIRSMTPIATGRGRGGIPSHYSGEKSLRDSWITQVRTWGPVSEGTIINRKAYAAAVEYGARPRTIEPKADHTFLRWPGILQEYGRARFKSVNWPGFGGRHMGELGMERARPGIVSRYNAAIKAALKGLFG
jgi:hypothetical protein